MARVSTASLRKSGRAQITPRESHRDHHDRSLARATLLGLHYYRWIGIVSILIGILTYFQETLYLSILLGIAGLILILSPVVRSQTVMDHFVTSITKVRTLWILVLSDLVFWTLLLLVGVLFATFLQSSFERLNPITQNTILAPEMVSQNLTLFKLFFTETIVGIIVSAILLALLYSFFTTISYGSIMNVPFTKQYFARMLRYSAGYILIASSLLALALVFFREELIGYVLIALFVVLTHFALVMNPLLARYMTVRQSLHAAMARMVNLRYFLYYSYAIVIYVIVAQLFAIVSAAAQTIGLAILTTIMSAVIFLWYTAWIKEFTALAVTDEPHTHLDHDTKTH